MKHEVFAIIMAAPMLLALPAPLQAEEFCVTNSAELQSALTAAASNGQSDSIRIAAGNYMVPSGGFEYQGASDYDITITGGWTEGFDNYPCGFWENPEPGDTVLNGNGAELILFAAVNKDANFTIRWLTFTNGYWSESSISPGGLRVLTSWPYSATITIESNHFLFNEGNGVGGASAGYAGTDSAQLRVINNLFVGNHARGNGTGAFQGLVSQSTETAMTVEGIIIGPSAAISFVNNTVVNNTIGASSALNGATGGVKIAGDVPAKWVVNNNLWGNQFSDLIIDNNAGYNLFNNNIGVRTGNEPSNSSDNISVDPQYVGCGIFCLHREPVTDSPLIDAGRHPLALIHPWYIPNLDASSRTRVIGPAVDIGAYENQSRLFVDRFE